MFVLADEPNNRLLALWIWPTLIQKELDDVRDQMNKRKGRKQKEKALPSGVSPQIAYDLYKEYGGEWCLLPVDVEVVQQIMDDILLEEDPFDWEVPIEFKYRCEKAYANLNIGELTMQNGWSVFTDMLVELEKTI
jgi:hypothetical protein